MPKRFFKKKECGCIIVAITCGITYIDKLKMWLIGGHSHFTICDKCKQYEENEVDTLYDTWINDNITNDSKYAGWEDTSKLKFYNSL